MLKKAKAEFGSKPAEQAKNLSKAILDSSHKIWLAGLGAFSKAQEGGAKVFDTLVQQLSEPELEAVLAHEIGHYKKRHIPKMMLFSAASLFVAFYLIAWLSHQDWFLQPFGFNAQNGIEIGRASCRERV